MNLREALQRVYRAESGMPPASRTRHLEALRHLQIKTYFGEAACKFLDIRVHCSLSNDSSQLSARSA